MTSGPSGHRMLLVAIFAAALVLRLAAAVWWQVRLGPEHRFAFGDSETYWVLGQQLARGQPFQYGSPDARMFRMPGYPALLAALFRLVGDDPPVLWVRGLGAVLGTAAVAGVYWLGRQLFDPTVGAVSAALAAVYPGAIGASVFVLSEAPFCPLLVGQLVVAVAAWRSAHAHHAVLLAAAAGALAGVATLMRPSWLAFVPLATLLGFSLGPPRQRHLLLGGAALAGLAVVMSPWWIRNARLVGHFVPTTLQLGASLYDGWNDRADGSSCMDFVRPIEALERQNEAQSSEPFEYRLDRRFRHEALAWAAAHPRRVLSLAAVKFVRLWNIWPNEAQGRSWLVRLVLALGYVPTIGLALAGVWKFAMRGGAGSAATRWPYVLCALPAVYFTLLHMVFVSSIRYREPAMLVLVVFAAAALLGAVRGRRRAA